MIEVSGLDIFNYIISSRDAFKSIAPIGIAIKKNRIHKIKGVTVRRC